MDDDEDIGDENATKPEEEPRVRAVWVTSLTLHSLGSVFQEIGVLLKTISGQLEAVARNRSETEQ